MSKKLEVEEPQATALDGVDGTPAAVTAESGLNLRQGPNRFFAVVETAPRGTVVKILALPYGAQVPGWVLVHTGARTCWAMEKYLTALEA